MRTVIKTFIGLLVVGVAVAGFGIFMLYRAAFTPLDTLAQETVRHTIAPGSTPSQINHQLEELGLIGNAQKANLIVRFKEWSHVQAGEYELSAAMSLEEMYQLFAAGEVAEARHRVTIPEGERLTFIAGVMAPVVGLSREELIEAWADPIFLQTLIDDYWFITDEILNEDLYYPLEGYLYPLTFEFRDETYSVDFVTRHLLDAMAQRIDPLREVIENNEFTFHEILAFAAIIEGETQNVEEMGDVSGVFHNRLAINMRLQTDVTVQYIAEERNVRVGHEMLAIESPFNTYHHWGLPPGPVNSPSIHSIEAVLNPTENDYLFFIADMFNCVDGKKHFFTNFDDHMEFFNNYLLPSYEAGESVCQ